mmetsp:Transcript_937/g.2271  ORF Transcript_937/g.2271 Transcript_937/m.2271 type:complete len:200 (-) Transcript_937:2311-2910(-)
MGVCREFTTGRWRSPMSRNSVYARDIWHPSCTVKHAAFMYAPRFTKRARSSTENMPHSNSFSLPASAALRRSSISSNMSFSPSTFTPLTVSDVARNQRESSAVSPPSRRNRAASSCRRCDRRITPSKRPPVNVSRGCTSSCDGACATPSDTTGKPLWEVARRVSTMLPIVSMHRIVCTGRDITSLTVQRSMSQSALCGR